MSKVKILLFLQFVFFFSLPVLAQVDTAWVRRYNGPGNDVDQANSVTVDTSGNVYVTGYSEGSGGIDDYATIKYGIPLADSVRNHYKTWRIQPLPVDTFATVWDQFMFDTLILDTIDFLSNPVLKVVQNDTFTIKKPDHHLNWYQVEGRDTLLEVEYVNQFESTAVDIDSVKYLLVPVQKPPHLAPESLDHYKCYRIKDTLQIIRQFRLKDQFDSLYQSNQFELIDSVRRAYFCTPCQKNGEPIFDTITHYVAYSFTPDTLPAAPILGTFDQFGTHPVQVYQSEMALVPTKKLRVRVPSPPPSDFGKNHYKTWRIQPILFHDSVFVRDQFMENILGLDSIEFLSNPVQKVVGNDTSSIKKPDDHLNWYKARGRDTLLKVEYVNQFESTSVQIDSVKYLLVPAQKDGHPAPESLDHYKCYKIRNPQMLVRPVELLDQFDMYYPELIDTLVPLYFCTPAQKNYEPMYDTITHYVAYLIKPQRSISVRKYTWDQFGAHYVDIDTSKILLVPTKKLRVTVPPSDFGGNHYKTWRIQPQPVDTFALAWDQFMLDTLILDTIDFLSNPVLKVVQNDIFTIKKPDHHLNWYRTEGRDTLIRVEYVNQFESTAVDIDLVKYLLVPAQKPPHPFPESLDHYKCYKIRDDSLLIRQFRLKDQFDSLYQSNQSELIDSLKRVYFCAPCRKNNEPVYDTVTHYVAYSFVPDTLPVAPILGTLDQFGPHPVQVYQSEMVLVPTRKTSLHGPFPLLCLFKPGDVNGSGNWTLHDIVALVNIVFKGAAKPVPLCRADCNGTGGNPTLVDIVCLVTKVFKSGPNPVKIGECCL